jgi:homoserine dehydrogenase
VPRRIRLAIVGFGTVGRWLAEAVQRRRRWLEGSCGLEVALVAVATRRDGFVHREGGLDVPTLLALSSSGRPLAEHPGARRWASALEGLAATETDVLAEASNTDPRQPEPALSHIRQALARGAHVITSSKGACAASAVELLALARARGAQLRMESTVMSGTPVLSTIREGLAGARVTSLRGILNATANAILTAMADGLDYGSALAAAQARGYAEPDPANDVEGHDSVAKARILAAIAYGATVGLDQVFRRGIAGMSSREVLEATRAGARVKLVVTIMPVAPHAGTAGSAPTEIRVEPVALPLADPLARVDGVMNALAIQTDTVDEVIVLGPGAGPAQAGQGMFADLAALCRSW